MKKKVCRTLAALLAGFTALMLAAEPATADTVGDEGAFVQKLNGLRASRGLRPLAVDGTLTNVARNWSATMAGAGTIWHNPNLSRQAPSNWTRLGENVGMGGSVDSLHNAFVSSPSHYQNMVNGHYTSVGVGVRRSANGTMFVTVDFMTTPQAASAAPVARPSCKRNRRGRCVKVKRVRKARRARR